MYTPYFDAYTPPYIRLSWRTSVGQSRVPTPGALGMASLNTLYIPF